MVANCPDNGRGFKRGRSTGQRALKTGPRPAPLPKPDPPVPAAPAEALGRSGSGFTSGLGRANTLRRSWAFLAAAGQCSFGDEPRAGQNRLDLWSPRLDHYRPEMPRRRLVPAKVSERRTFDLVEIQHEVVVRLRPAAASRSMPVQSLIRELLDIIAHDGLTTAVLDDDAG